MIGEIPKRFNGTVEDFLSQAYHLSTYKSSDGPFRMSYPQVTPGVSTRISIGENGWALAQRLPDGGCLITVGVEGEDEVMWQRFDTRLERLGFWESEQPQIRPDAAPIGGDAMKHKLRIETDSTAFAAHLRRFARKFAREHSSVLGLSEVRVEEWKLDGVPFDTEGQPIDSKEGRGFSVEPVFTPDRAPMALSEKAGCNIAVSRIGAVEGPNVLNVVVGWVNWKQPLFASTFASKFVAFCLNDVGWKATLINLAGGATPTGDDALDTRKRVELNLELPYEKAIAIAHQILVKKCGSSGTWHKFETKSIPDADGTAFDLRWESDDGKQFPKQDTGTIYIYESGRFVSQPAGLRDTENTLVLPSPSVDDILPSNDFPQIARAVIEALLDAQAAPQPPADGQSDAYPSVATDLTVMRKHYRDYAVPTAKAVLDALPNAHADYSENGGEWGPAIITKHISLMIGSTTTGRYLSAFRRAGMTEFRGIPLPGRASRIAS